MAVKWVSPVVNWVSPAGHRRRSSVLIAAAFAAGSLSLAASAYASGPLGAARPTVFSAAIPYAPCHADGVTPAENAIADGLRPWMSGQRLGQSVTGYSISCARAIVLTVDARGLNQRAAVIALTAAITESTLHNYTVAVDHDSLGLFQQRPSMGWGQPGQLVDPGFATQAFLNAMLRKHPDGGWLTGDIGEICQRVQGSAYPAAYAPEMHDAQLLVARLWPGSAAPAVTPATEPAAAKKSDGPFQRTLLAAGTGLGPTDARHDMSLADWNGDRRADLVVVQRSDTASGRTELYIMDGASGFQRLLLHTGTVLGPTDDRYAFSMADWNGDGRLDLVVVQKSGTASGWTELRVIDGASSFQRYLLETVTLLGPTGDDYAFSMADWNGDGRLDLVAVQKSGAASGRTEVQVLDGASSFQRYQMQTSTTLGPTDDRYQMSVTDWNRDRHPDLVVVQTSGTTSRHTEVRVLDGASSFRHYLLQTSTAQGTTDNRYAVPVADWNGDGRPDLVILQKSGTASGWTEARVLAG